MTTVPKSPLELLADAFGDEWVTTSRLISMGVSIPQLIELRRGGVFQRRVNRFIGVEWQLNPVQGCEVPPKKSPYDKKQKPPVAAQFEVNQEVQTYYGSADNIMAVVLHRWYDAHNDAQGGWWYTLSYEDKQGIYQFIRQEHELTPLFVFVKSDAKTIAANIETAFGNEWFGKLSCENHNIPFELLSGVAKLGYLESRVDSYGFKAYRLLPVHGCELPPTFKYGQIVKFPAPYADDGSMSYGVITKLHPESVVIRVYRSNDDIANERILNNGVHYSACRISDITLIEGIEWDYCPNCKQPFPHDELSDTVVSLCVSCADVEDLPLIVDMINERLEGQSIDHYASINSGRAYDKYLLDVDYWQRRVKQVQKARLSVTRNPIAHEDLLDAAQERREVR